MTKIYEALRRHERQSIAGQALLRGSDPAGDAEPADRLHRGDDSRPADQPHGLEESQFPGESHSASNFLVAQLEMQALHRSVAPLIADQQAVRMIMFSSAHSGEGKTTVCGSYAATLAQSFGKSVLVLDADREHALTRQWGSHRDAIVSTLDRAPDGSDTQTGRRVGVQGVISVVPIGLSSTDSQELALIGTIKERLAGAFDYILIDGRAVADLSSSIAIGSIADGVVLVVEAERTRWPVALHAKRELEASGARVMGVFLNRRRYHIPAQIYRRI
jgi:protein-tyrosine kinase